MAWRIAHNIIRGEIDNTERGLVRGRLWLAGVPEPITLELQGNACPDLAGCTLSFRNTVEVIPFRDEQKLAPHQQGPAGDLTASRKVRILDPDYEVDSEDLFEEVPRPADKFANAVYLEWYSNANGRVVIESTDFQVEISAPAWRLSPEEEIQRQADSALAFSNFLKGVDQAVQAATFDLPEDRPWDEFDYEKFLRESDARTDKYGELLDKYGHSPEAQEIVHREMGWDLPASDEEIPDDDEEEQRPADIDWDFDEAMAIEPEPETEGVDWVRDETGDICHPLYLRARNASQAFWKYLDERGFKEEKNLELQDLLTNWHILTAKLAGALNSLGYGYHEGGFVVACLKRSLPHLQNTLGALEKVASEKLLPPEKISEIRFELFGTREEILRLMEEFRGKSSED